MPAKVYGKVTLPELADLLGLDRESVAQLAKQKVLVRSGRKYFDATRSITNCIEALRAKAAAHDRTAADTTAGVRLKDARRRLIELRLQRERGELLNVDDVRHVWDPLLRSVRQAVLGLPGVVVFESPLLTGRDRAVLDDICRRSLLIVSGAKDHSTGDDDDQDD